MAERVRRKAVKKAPVKRAVKKAPTPLTKRSLACFERQARKKRKQDEQDGTPFAFGPFYLGAVPAFWPEYEYRPKTNPSWHPELLALLAPRPKPVFTYMRPAFG